MAGIEGRHLNGSRVFTRNIAAAASLIAIGARLRASMPITVTKAAGRPDETLFWFDNHEIECGGIKRSTNSWLTLFLCPWSAFDLSLDHPAAFLKAAAENRQVLVAGVKTAEKQPFKLIQRGNRVAVLGPAVSEDNARQLMSL